MICIATQQSEKSSKSAYDPLQQRQYVKAQLLQEIHLKLIT